MSANPPNKTQILKALLKAAGDDLNTFLCARGYDSTRMRDGGVAEHIIEQNLETAIDNKIADLIDELSMPVAA